MLIGEKVNAALEFFVQITIERVLAE